MIREIKISQSIYEDIQEKSKWTMTEIEILQSIKDIQEKWEIIKIKISHGKASHVRS